MPLDLSLAAIGLWVCCAIAFAGGSKWGERASRRSNWLLVGSLLISAGFACLISGRLWWAKLIPSSAAILWSNWTPILLALGAGISLHAIGLRREMRPFSVVSLTLIALLGIVLPVARSALRPAADWGEPTWKGEICIQSSGVSCAPAAAATLLHWHRIAASERELASGCLTGFDGTAPLGLYRGLLLATAGCGCRPVIMPGTADALAASTDLPAVALVRLDAPAESTRVVPLDRLLGRHEGHAVVVFGRNEHGMWKVGDPSLGFVLWQDSYFRSHWNGEAIGLTRSSR